MNEEPVFPPLLNGIAVAPGTDTASVAVAAVIGGEAGAGDLYWSQSEDRLNMAIVLEPDVPLSRAAQVRHVLAVAFGDAFGAISPPEIGVHYRWPGDILVNGARAGGITLDMPAGVTRDQVPSWMVLGLDVAITLDLSVDDPGELPDSTTLHEEGAGDVTRTMLLESVSRHFLTWIDGWMNEGFKAVHENWLGRAMGSDTDVTVSHGGVTVSGRVTGMDEEGNLLFTPVDKPVQALALVDTIVGHRAP
ncbi:MAG: biotin/lipoate--protein ligase family protein [Anderseniella sp.]